MQNKNISSLTKLNFQIKTSQSLGILQPHPNFLIKFLTCNFYQKVTFTNELDQWHHLCFLLRLVEIWSGKNRFLVFLNTLCSRDHFVDASNRHHFPMDISGVNCFEFNDRQAAFKNFSCSVVRLMLVPHTLHKMID